MQLDLRILVDGPGNDTLERKFELYWPRYRAWMARSSTQDAGLCRRMLAEHMPELWDTYIALCDRLGHTDEVARFLTLYDPPRVIRACTQLVLDTESGPTLLRSYDHHPKLFDGIVLISQWNSARTLAMTDCIFGALDGMNEHGLAIALAFGGRNTIGGGFSAPLICRYILETCSTVAEASSVLGRLPVYMPYTFVVVDKAGDFVTAFLGPDRPAHLVTKRASTNHQGCIEWPEYARFSESAARLELAESLVTPPGNIDEARTRFLHPPLWRSDYASASATLYVAEYATATGTLDLHWPGQSERVMLSETCQRWAIVSLPAQTLK